MSEIYYLFYEIRKKMKSFQQNRWAFLGVESLILKKIHLKIVTIFMLVFSFTMTNCSTSLKSYAKDRARDAADVFSVNLIYPAIGFKMDITGLSIGGHYTPCQNSKGYSTGLRGGALNFNVPTCDSTHFIGTGTFTNGASSTNSGKDEEWFEPTEADTSFYRRKRFKQGWDFPGYLYGRIGFSISFLIGIQVHYNMGEDLDLVLGWLGIDIFDDDMYSKLERDEKNADREETSRRGNSYTKVDYETVLRSAQENFDLKNYQKASELASYVVVNSNDSQLKGQAKALARKAILRYSYQKAAEENSLGE